MFRAENCILFSKVQSLWLRGGGGGDIWSITDLKFDITNVMLGREQNMLFTCR